MQLQREEPELTVVVLAYNEAASLRAVVEEAMGVLGEAGALFEIIIVDDGSSDKSGAIARELAREHAAVRALHHERNQGMGAGLRTGFSEARGRWLSFLPADGQIDPRDMLRLLARADPAQIVLSVYERRDDGLHRMLLSRGLRLLTWLLTGSRWRNEGPYLLHRGLEQRFASRSDTFFFNLELAIRCERAGIEHAVITTRARPRRAGRSKVTGLSRIIKVARELWRVGRLG